MIVHIVKECNHALDQAIFELMDFELEQGKAFRDSFQIVNNCGSDKKRICVANEDAVHLTWSDHKMLEVRHKHLNVPESNLGQELLYHRQFQVHHKRWGSERVNNRCKNSVVIFEHDLVVKYHELHADMYLMSIDGFKMSLSN